MFFTPANLSQTSAHNFEFPALSRAAHIAGATQWHDEIGRALERSKWFLLILTPHSVRSAWVKRELLFALNEPRYKSGLIPLLANSCDFPRLSWTLKEFQFVDFRGDFDRGGRELLKVWKKRFQPRKTASKR